MLFKESTLGRCVTVRGGVYLSCLPVEVISAVQGPSLALVWCGRAGRAAQVGAVGGSGVTRRVRILKTQKS